MNLRDEAVDAVLALEERRPGAAVIAPAVTEYVDAVLNVVRLRVAAVVLDLSNHGELTPAGARAVRRVLDDAGVTA